MDAILLREARPSDADALGAVHVASWRESYAGLLPDDLLNSLSAEARSDMWRAVLGDPATCFGMTIFVAEKDGGICGFGACGSQRDEGLNAKGFGGEFGAIYVLKSHQRGGVGNTLMRMMSRRLADQGRGAAALWVLRENLAARRFYEHLGGEVVGEREVKESGLMLAEMAYGWSDLSALVR